MISEYPLAESQELRRSRKRDEQGWAHGKAMRLPSDSHEPLDELSCPWNQPKDSQLTQ